jgi:hypothetical protein
MDPTGSIVFSDAAGNARPTRERRNETAVDDLDKVVQD